MAVGFAAGVGTRWAASRFLVPRVGQLGFRNGVEGGGQDDRAGDRALGPQIRMTGGGLGTVLFAQQSFELLLVMQASRPEFSPSLLNRYTSALRGIGRIEEAAKILESELNAALKSEALGVARASSNTAGVRASASNQAQEGEYTFRVLQPARGHRVASASVGDILTPLGLEGTLTIEGKRLELRPGDALMDVARSIRAAFTESHAGVTVQINEQNQLILERASAGPFRIRMEQEGNVATALGLLQPGEGGRFEFARELVSPQSAMIEIAGERRVVDNNRLESLFFGLNVELIPELFAQGMDEFGHGVEEPVDVNIRVSRDTQSARAMILRFVGSYNRMMEVFNEETFYAGSLEGDRSFAAARRRLIRILEEPPSDEEQRDIRNIGLEVQRGHPSQVSAFSLRRLVGLGGFPSLPGFSRGKTSIIAELGRIGIQATEDGTLRVDQFRLDQALNEQPELVENILTTDDQSVLPRLGREIARIRHGETGILSRRRNLFEMLQSQSDTALARKSLDVDYELLDTTRKHLRTMQSFYRKLG